MKLVAFCVATRLPEKLLELELIAWPYRLAHERFQPLFP
jgi:hypothetical protein